MDSDSRNAVDDLEIGSDERANTTNVDSNNQEQSPSPVVTNVGPTRVPGSYPPEWLPDHETDSCMSCDNLFTLIKRRHHCRSCGKIFCGECCRQKARLLYLDNKEARVCSSCYSIIECTLLNASSETRDTALLTEHRPSSSNHQTNQTSQNRQTSNGLRVQGVLKTSNQARSSEFNPSTSSSDQQYNKQVMFADGIRPGTDLSESSQYPVTPGVASGSSASASFSLLTRQNSGPENQGSSKKSISNKSGSKNITVCDEQGYLPPIVIRKNSPIASNCDINTSSSSSLASLITSQFKALAEKKTIQASMESRSCPLNGVIKFDEISDLVGVDGTVTFLLLRDFYLMAKLVKKQCCIDKDLGTVEGTSKKEDPSPNIETFDDSFLATDVPRYWSFASDGLARYGQSEIILVIDKDKDDSCIPRDVFKLYLTLHELALRRQTLENLGNLLFQDGLFGNRDTAGLLFVRPSEEHCLESLVLPRKPFLVALVLQRWEAPWSKVFPVRLLLRLGHKFNTYPYPIISFRAREPVYYEVGHTIVSILGDFRNFRYSITHVDGLKVSLNKATRKVLVQLSQSSYQQFNKVLDSSNNEHVLAWSCCPFQEADGHLVSVQNDDGQYETVEFLRRPEIGSEPVLGASFIVFSGALKVNQSGHSAKISIVEDGLLIQIQSCTMSALRNAIHFMHHFDIDCENNQDTLNRVEINWNLHET